MWAPTALSFRLLPATIIINNNRPITVSATKHPRHQKNNNNKNITYDFSDEEDEEQEPEPETYVSNDQQQETYVSSTNNDGDVNKISGSAVLLALQRASAVKTSKKAKKKKVVIKKVNDENVSVDYGDVKELCIKSDWKERLDDLEMKLHHLVHHDT